MAYQNLSSFIGRLEDDGDIVRVAAQVDPAFEIAEITRRVCASADGGPALFFEDVKGSTLPVVTNLLGSERRLCRALGAESFDHVAQRIAAILQPDLPAGLMEGLKLVPQLSQVTKIPPRSVKSGDCQQVVKIGRDVKLSELPVVHAWPQEAAATITMGQVYTRDPKSGRSSVGMYPLEVRDQSSLAVHWNAHDAGWQTYEHYRRDGRQMPVAIALGGDPVLTYTACAPLPHTTDACLFAGFLRGDNVELVKCRSVDLEVPADVEIVIEGMIDTLSRLEPGGLVAAPTGYYAMTGDAPVLKVTALTHRSNPVYPALILGGPRTESYWLGKANERIFLPLLRMFVPELVDLHVPRAGVFRNLAFVSIEKQYPQQARKVMNALWGLDGLMVTKIIVVVDSDVDVHDEERVWLTVGANVHPGRDALFCEGPTHMDDHAAPVRGMGHKLGIDATRKLPEEGHPRRWPPLLTMNPEIVELVTRRWGEYGIGKP